MWDVHRRLPGEVQIPLEYANIGPADSLNSRSLPVIQEA